MELSAIQKKYITLKESNVPWLKSIPNSWEILPAKRFHSVVKELNSKRQCNNVLSLTLRGVVNNNPDNPEGLVPKDYGTYQIFEKNDLVFKLIDLENVSTSRVGLVHEKGIMSSAYIRLIAGDDSVPKYVYYYYFSLYQNEVYNKIGSGVRSTLGPNDLLNLPFVKPSKDEQTAIANFLDQKTAQIDKAIVQKEKLIGLLNERKQIAIQNAVIKGLDTKVTMKDSGVEWIGEIPDHWGITRNASLFSQTNFPGSEGLPILTVSIHSAVSKEELSDEENLRGTVRSEDKSVYKYVQVEDIVYNMMRAWQGAIGSVPTEGMVSPAYVTARAIRNYNTKYFEYLYRTSKFINQMNQFSRGIADFRKRLYWNEFKQLTSLVPPIEEQLEIVEYVETVSKKYENACEIQKIQIERLKEYKVSLIDSAVTGKIKVC